MDRISREKPVVLLTPQYKTTALLNQKIIMINRQKVDTSAAIGMPFDSVFEMRKTSGSSNRPVFELVHLVGEKNLMQSDERDVQAAGDYDNRNLKDDGSSQALDYEEIERLKAEGLRDQAMVDHLVAHSKTFEEKTDFSKAKYLRKKQAKYCCRVKVCRPSVQLMWDQFSNNVGNVKDNKIGQLRFDTLAQIVDQADVQFGSRLLLVENCMGLVAAALLERLGGSGSLVHMHNYQSNHSVISRTHRGDVRIPILPAVCSTNLRKPLVDLPLSELTWMLENEHLWPSRLIEWVDSHPSGDLHTLLDNYQPMSSDGAAGGARRPFGSKGSRPNHPSAAAPVQTTGQSSDQCGDSPMDVDPAESSRSEAGTEEMDGGTAGVLTPSLSGNATPAESSSSPSTTTGTTASGLCRDQVAACPSGPMVVDSRLERVIMLARAKRDLWKRNYHGLILCTSYHPWPLVEKLIGFVGPSRPVVIYSHIKEPLLECFDHMVSSPMFNAVRIIEPWMREHQVLPDRSHPMMRMVASGGYLLVAATVMTKTVLKSHLPHFKVRAHKEHEVMSGDEVVREAMRILQEKGLDAGSTAAPVGEDSDHQQQQTECTPGGPERSQASLATVPEPARAALPPAEAATAESGATQVVPSSMATVCSKPSITAAVPERAPRHDDVVRTEVGFSVANVSIKSEETDVGLETSLLWDGTPSEHGDADSDIPLILLDDWTAGDDDCADRTAQQTSLPVMAAAQDTLPLSGAGAGMAAAQETLPLSGAGAGMAATQETLPFSGAGAGMAAAQETSPFSGAGVGMAATQETLPFSGAGAGMAATQETLPFSGAGAAMVAESQPVAAISFSGAVMVADSQPVTAMSGAPKTSAVAGSCKHPRGRKARCRRQKSPAKTATPPPATLQEPCASASAIGANVPIRPVRELLAARRPQLVQHVVASLQRFAVDAGAGFSAEVLREAAVAAAATAAAVLAASAPPIGAWAPAMSLRDADSNLSATRPTTAASAAAAAAGGIGTVGAQASRAAASDSNEGTARVPQPLNIASGERIVTFNAMIGTSDVRIVSSDARIVSSDARIASSGTRIVSSDARIASSGTRIVSSDARIVECDARVAGAVSQAAKCASTSLASPLATVTSSESPERQANEKVLGPEAAAQKEGENPAAAVADGAGPGQLTDGRPSTADLQELRAKMDGECGTLEHGIRSLTVKIRAVQCGMKGPDVEAMEQQLSNAKEKLQAARQRLTTLDEQLSLTQKEGATSSTLKGNTGKRGTKVKTLSISNNKKQSTKRRKKTKATVARAIQNPQNSRRIQKPQKPPLTKTAAGDYDPMECLRQCLDTTHHPLRSGERRAPCVDANNPLRLGRRWQQQQQQQQQQQRSTFEARQQEMPDMAVGGGTEDWQPGQGRPYQEQPTHEAALQRLSHLTHPKHVSYTGSEVGAWGLQYVAPQPPNVHSPTAAGDQLATAPDYPAWSFTPTQGLHPRGLNYYSPGGSHHGPQ